MKRTFAAVIAMTMWAIVLWVGGYNFDTRGVGPAYGLVIGIFIGVMALLYPWEDEK